ncbi:MAG: hypothetical protein V1908_02145 [Candidatus Peregrinibacteria bacterium]
MSKPAQLLISLDPDLKKMAMSKCKNQFGVPLSTFIKFFLKSFVSRGGIGFYIGEEHLLNLFDGWLRRKRAEKLRGKDAWRLPGPLTRDLWETSSS